MGWASGSQIANDIIEHPEVQVLEDKERKGVFRAVFEALEGHDWDTIDESMGLDPMFDEVVREKYPDWFDED